MPSYRIDVEANTNRAADQVRSALGDVNRQVDEMANRMRELQRVQLSNNLAVQQAQKAYDDLARAQQNLARNTADRISQAASLQTTLAKEQQSLLDLKKLYLELQQTKKLASDAGNSSGVTTINAQMKIIKDAIKEQTLVTAQAGLNFRAMGKAVEDNVKAAASLTPVLQRAGAELSKVKDQTTGTKNSMGELRSGLNEVKDRASGLREQLKGLSDEERRAQQETDRLAKESLTGAVVAGNILTRVLGALKDILVGGTIDIVQYAARTIELGIAMEQIGRVTGHSAGEMHAYENSIKRLNITTQDARQVLSQFAIAQLDMSKAGQLARVAQDLAVTAGVDTAEEFQKLTQGIETLQIRVLRTAGVFLTLNGEVDKVSKATGRAKDSFSETEKQQILLNAVLEFGARATGTYEAAMESAAKQQRSFTRLWAEAKNALGDLVQGPFLAIILAIGALLKAISQLPGTFALIVASVTAMGISIALNTKLLQGWTSGALQATKVAFGFARAQNDVAVSSAAASAAQAEASVASTGGKIAGGIGLGAVGVYAAAAVAIGAVAYGAYQLATAEEKLDYQKDEDIRLSINQIKVNEKDAGVLRAQASAHANLSEALGEGIDGTKLYSLALNRLSPEVAARISQEKDHATQLRLVGEELDKLSVKERQRLVETSGLDYAGDLAHRRVKSEKEDELKNLKYGNFIIGYSSHASTFGLDEAVNKAVTGKSITNKYLSDQKELKTAIETEKAEHEAFINRSAETQRLTHQTTEEFITLNFHVGKGSQEFNQLSKELDGANAKFKAQQELLTPANQFLKEYGDAIDSIKLPKFNFEETSRGVDEFTSKLVAQSKAAREAGLSDQEIVSGSREAYKKLNETVARASHDQDDYNNRIAVLVAHHPEMLKLLEDAEMAPKIIEKVGEAASRTAAHIYDTQVRLRYLTQEIHDLSTGEGEAGQLNIDEANLQAYKRELEQIRDAKRELGQDQGALPESREERDALLRGLSSELKLRTSLRELLFSTRDAQNDVVKAQAEAQMEVVDAATRAAISIAKLSRQRRDDEESLTAKVVEQAYKRENIERDTTKNTIDAWKELFSEGYDQISKNEKDISRTNASILLNANKTLYGGRFGELPTSTLPNLQLPEFKINETVLSPQAQAMGKIDTNVKDIRDHLLGAGGASDGSKPVQNYGAGNTQDLVTAVRRAIIGQESGGKYSIVNPDSGALGYGQVLPSNVKSWTRSALGHSLTPSEFLNDPNAQLTTINHQLSTYLDRELTASGGDIETAIRRVAATWYSGRPGLYNSTAPQFSKGHPYPSISSYSNKVLGRTKSELGGSLVGYDKGIPVIQVPAETTPVPQVSTAPLQLSAFKNTFYQNVLASQAALGNPFTVGFNAPSSFDKGTPASQTAILSGQLSRSENAHNDVLGDYRSGKRQTQPYLQDLIDSEKSRFTSAEDVYRKIDVLRYQEDKDVERHAGIRKDAYARVELSRLERAKATRDKLLELDATEDESRTAFHHQELIDKSEIARREGALQTRDRITELEQDIAHVSEGTADRVRVAYLETWKDVASSSEQAQIDMARNSVKIADANVLHFDRVQAKLTDWVASQKSLDDVLAESLTAPWEASFNFLDRGLTKVTKRFGELGTAVKDILLNLAKLALSRVFQSVFGGAIGGTPSQTFAGNNTNGISTGFGSIFKNSLGLISGSGSSGNSAATNFGGYITPSFNPNSLSPSSFLGVSPTSGGLNFGTFAGQARSVFSGGGGSLGNISPAPGYGAFGQPSLADFLNPNQLNSIGVPDSAPRAAGFGSQLYQNLASGATSAISKTGALSLSSILPQLGAAAPLLGLGLGSSLGGQSGLGRIIGGAGGLLLGGTAAAILAPSLFGAIGFGVGGTAIGGAAGGVGLGGAAFGLLTNPFTIAAGIGLLAAALIIGKNKARQKDEVSRAKSINEALAQIEQLTRAVQTDKTDGASALSKAAEIRAQYLDTVSQLKDKKTRNIALQDVSRIDVYTSRLRAAQVAQERRKELDKLLVPEFATGGLVGGIDRGYDSVIAKLRPREVVLTREHQMMLGGDQTFKAIGVPGFASGGVVNNVGANRQPISRLTQSSSNESPITIVLVSDQRDADRIVTKGRKQIINLAAESISDQGQLYTALRQARL